MQPTIGRIVHYTLTEQDVSIIASRRASQAFPAGIVGRHNPVSPGDTYPAMVVRVFHPSTSTANLQVFLDGTDTYWATSRAEGEPGEHGRWIWPPRV